MNETLPTVRRATALMGGLLIGAAALAHGGEDHAAPAATTASALLPRVGVTTDGFELVAVLEPGRLLIHVDRADSNLPVAQAQLEVEGAGPTALAAEVSPGVYALPLAQALAAGAHALTFTLQTADDGDLIAATLTVPASGAASSRAAASEIEAKGSWPWLAGGAAIAMAGMSLSIVRRRSAVQRA